MLRTDAIPPADVRLPVDQVLNGAPSGLGRAINKPRRPKFSGGRGVGRLSLRSYLGHILIKNTKKRCIFAYGPIKCVFCNRSDFGGATGTLYVPPEARAWRCALAPAYSGGPSE